MVKGRLGCGSAQEWLKGPGPLVWRRTFPGRTDQIREARRLAAALFAGTAREDDVALIVTELCSNAVLYTRSSQPGGWFGLELVLDDLAYVAVTDLGGVGAPSLPSRMALHNEPCLGGRGLFLASQLAFTIGVHGSPAVGHTVWTDIDMHTQPHAEQTTPLAS